MTFKDDPGMFQSLNVIQLIYDNWVSHYRKFIIGYTDRNSNFFRGTLIAA